MYVIVRRQYHDIQSIDLKVDRVWINLKPVQTMVRNLDPKVKCGYNTIGGGGGSGREYLLGDQCLGPR